MDDSNIESSISYGQPFILYLYVFSVGRASITKNIKIYMPIETIASSTLVKHGTLAFFGAIVHALSAQRSGTSKSFLDFIVLVIMSSFTGVMFTLLALHFLPTAPYLAYAASGAGGYIGVEGMSFIVGMIKSKLK